MSIENRESVWNFKTPEELAKALEEKSKNNLAERIRTLWIEAKNNSKSAREALKSWLSDAERTEITQTLPDKWLEVDLWVTSNKPEKKDPATEAWKAAIASAIWEDNAEKLEKWMSFFDKVSTWFDKIWEIFDKKWFIAWIWAVFMMLKWIFSWDFSALDGILNPEKKESEKKEEWKDEWQNNEVVSNKEKIIWVILSKISWLPPEKREKIPSILNDKNISTKNFNFIKDFYDKNKDKNWWNKDLKISENYKDEEIKNSFKIIIEKENLIDDLLKKEYPNWREKSIWEIFVLISPSLSLLKNITEIKSIDDLKDKFNFWEITTLPWSEWKLNLWDSEEKFKKLQETYKWLNTNTLYHLKTSAHDFSYNEFTYEWQKWIDKKEEIEFMKTLKDYAPKIEKQLIDNFSLELWEKIWDLLKNHPLKMSEVVDLFIITWWKTDWFNNLEKSYLYLKLIKIIDVRKEDVLLWEYYSKLAKTIYSVSADKEIIPKEVKDVISSIFWSLWTVALNYIAWKFKILWWIIKDNPGASLLAAWAIIGLIMLLPKVWIATAAKAVIITAIVSILITIWVIKANDPKIETVKKELNDAK